MALKHLRKTWFLSPFNSTLFPPNVCVCLGVGEVGDNTSCQGHFAIIGIPDGLFELDASSALSGMFAWIF